MDRPLRIARVISRLNVGGPALHVMLLSERLNHGRHTTVLAAGTVGKDEGDYTPCARSRDLRLVSIPELGREVRLLGDLIAFVKLVRLFAKYRPDIVHTHAAKAGALGRVAAVLTRVPVRVHTFHGHVFRGYFGPFMSRLVILVERALGLLTHRVIVLSASQADAVSGTFGVIPERKLRVVPLGLELDRFVGAEPGREGRELRQELGLGGAPVVSIVGRLAPIKNHDLFMDMAAQVAERVTDSRFLIVGGGSEESRLRQRAAELGLAERVLFLGWRTDVERIYAASDLVVLCSNNEGTPVSLIEALAASRAVISTDVGGVRDILGNSERGVLVPRGQADTLSSEVERLLSDDRARKNLEAQGGARFAERFATMRLVRDLASLYDEALAERGFRTP